LPKILAFGKLNSIHEFVFLNFSTCFQFSNLEKREGLAGRSAVGAGRMMASGRKLEQLGSSDCPWSFERFDFRSKCPGPLTVLPFELAVWGCSYFKIVSTSLD
jgi:hypothetical protein